MEQKVIAIELPVSVWNIVMNALGQRPYLEVAEIINRMKEQADTSLRLAERELKETPETVMRGPPSL